MNWNRAIEINQTALRRVVEEIFALLELALDGTSLRLPRILHVAAIRLLCPAESALRRLIVIAARGVQAKPLRHRPIQPGKKIVAKGTGPLSFQLFDARKVFDRPVQNPTSKTIEPRIHVFSVAPLIANFLPKIKQQKTSARLCRRFAAFKLALENIPHQAKRLALWRLKRARKVEAKFRLPLRPGAPPGTHRKRMHEVDHVLRECHLLSVDAQKEAPS